MHEVLTSWFFLPVSHFCVAVSVLGSLYALIAAFCVRRFASRLSQGSRFAPGVTLLRPLCGNEPNLLAALSSFCTQQYAGPVQMIFGVHSAQDPAVAVVGELQVAFPDLDIELVVDKHIFGANRKVSNLVNMSGRIRHDIVVLADSDIVVAPDYLSRVVAALAPADIGLVTCVYRGLSNGGIWSRLSAAAVDLHFLPNVLVSLAGRLARPCFGSTIALRRETLALIGGFAAFNDELADDFAMGEAVRALGLKVAVPSIVVGHLSQEASFAALWRHEIRWARTIRLVDPVGYTGSGLTHAVPLALIGALAGNCHTQALVAVALSLISRTVLQWSVNHAWPSRDGPLIDLPFLILRDTLSFLVYAASFFAMRVRWRDLDYRVALGGTLVALKEDIEP